MSGGEGEVAACESSNRFANVLRIAPAWLDGQAAGDELVVFLGHAGGHVGFDDAGADFVDGDGVGVEARELPAGEGELADGAAAFDLGVGLAEVRGVDGRELPAERAAQFAAVGQRGDFVEEAALLGHVGRLEQGAGEHELPVQREALRLEEVEVERTRHVLDQDQRAHRGQRVDDLLVVFLGLRQAEHVVDAAGHERFDLGGEGLAMVDDMVRAEGEAPVARVGPRGGGDDGEAGKAAGELDCDRADAAGAADDEERAARRGIAGELEAVEEHLPGGDGGEGQGGGFGERERGGLAADEALVHGVEFGVGAVAVDGAGVINLVARLEAGGVRPGLDHDAGGVPAKAERRAGAARPEAGADLGVDGIDGDGADRDEQVACAEGGARRFEVEQSIRVGDREMTGKGDGFHGVVVIVKLRKKRIFVIRQSGGRPCGHSWLIAGSEPACRSTEAETRYCRGGAGHENCFVPDILSAFPFGACYSSPAIMVEDAELLRAYAESRSQAAFTELVRRHISLVYAVALRQVGGDTHLAQDVTQKVFVDLARKAGGLSRRAVLSGWLYRGARFAASDVVRAEQRRRRREQETQLMRDTQESRPADVTDWEQVRPVLDETLAELNEADRDAVALRFFENRSFAEIGRALCLNEEAARKRVERALEKMHGLLMRRGIRSTLVALPAVLSGQVTGAAPAGLAATVAGGVLAGVGTGTGGAFLAFMSLTKLQVGLAVGVVAVATGGISWYYQAGQPAAKGEAPPAQVAAAPAAAPRSAPPGSPTVAAPATMPDAGPSASLRPVAVDPSAAAQQVAQARRAILRLYGALYDKLGLNAEQREQLTQILVNDREASVDYATANAALGRDASQDPEGFTFMVNQTRQPLKDQVIALLGVDAYVEFVLGDVAVRQAAVIDRMQKSLKPAGSRLSAAQAAQLQGVLQELGVHHVTDAVVARASLFLSEPQMEALQAIQARRAHAEQKPKVQQAIQANLSGATTVPGSK